MQTRYHITEVYCCGYLATAYNVDTEAEALTIVAKVKQANEPHTSIAVKKQVRKWYQRHFRTVETIAEWQA